VTKVVVSEMAINVATMINYTGQDMIFNNAVTVKHYAKVGISRAEMQSLNSLDEI